MLFCRQKAGHPFNVLPPLRKKEKFVFMLIVGGRKSSLKILIWGLKIQMCCCSSHRVQVSSVNLRLSSWDVWRSRYTTSLFSGRRGERGVISFYFCRTEMYNICTFMSC